jgi:putative transposase
MWRPVFRPAIFSLPISYIHSRLYPAKITNSLSKMPIDRKSVRLPRKNYVGKGAYFLTICCALRRPHFADPALAHSVIQFLFQSASSNSFLLHAYCIMPDHIHVLAEGACPASDACEFIRRFKQLSGFYFKRSTHQLLWEFGYYDHILRNCDSMVEVARYIWWNPVRKGLCSHPNEYAFSGSQTIAWLQEARTASEWCAPWKAPV